MARRRFVAPTREAVDPAVFDHPAFAPYTAHRDLLVAREWPTIDTLNERLGERAHPASAAPLRFVAQSAALLADGLHYERRILERGAIATRERNWHDLLNALIWLEQTPLKTAMNARQVADLDRAVGANGRTRTQDALTQFDEAGAIVTVHDVAVVASWDRHDWRALFAGHRDAWLDRRIDVVIVGHALLEHLLVARDDLVAKCVVAIGAAAAERIGASIEGGALLTDPAEARPLPLCGIPGWHRDNAEPRFYVERACFAPARSGQGVRARGRVLTTSC